MFLSYVDNQVHSEMGAVIKSNQDKVLTIDVISKLFAELRRIPVKLNKLGVKQVLLD